MYTIHYRRELDLLDISWSGLFTPEEMIAYAEECRACLRQERFGPGYRLRIVLRDGCPLPKETLKVLAGAFTDFPKAGRAAMVTNGVIARLQIERAMLEAHMRIFTSPEEALDWLMAS